MKWSTALRLGRVSNLPTVWTNSIAGIVLAGADPLRPAGLAVAGALSAFYVGGMYLNDAFDAEADRVSRPTRPIPAGAARRTIVFRVGFTLLAFGIVAMAAVGRSHGAAIPAFTCAVGLVFAIVTYDVWHKGNRLGPVLMGLCRALAYIAAAAAVGHAMAFPVLVASATSVAYLVGLTYAAKQEDLRRAGSLWPLAALAAPFVYAVIVPGGPVGAVLVLLLGATVIFACRRMLSRDRKAIPGAVAALIAGICLVDGLFIAGTGHAILAGLTILGFALTLALQRVIAGT